MNELAIWLFVVYPIAMFVVLGYITLAFERDRMNFESKTQVYVSILPMGYFIVKVMQAANKAK